MMKKIEISMHFYTWKNQKNSDLTYILLFNEKMLSNAKSVLSLNYVDELDHSEI